jgi:hypothetical protein
MDNLQGYESVNNSWACDTREMRKPTGKEALKACRLLLREGFRAFGSRRQVTRKRRFKLTSGRNRTWPVGSETSRRGEIVQVWNVNPNECNLGFAEIIHSVSHWVHQAVNPGLVRQHGGGHNGHAHIEQYLVDWVRKQRWVEYGLKVRPDKPKPTKDEKKAAKLASTLKRLEAWRAKERRATTAIRKLNASVKRLQA